MAPRSFPRCTVPDGWMPLKMRGRWAGASIGAGAGAVSTVMVGECSGGTVPIEPVRRAEREPAHPLG